MKPFTKILVPTDFSAHASEALEAAIDLARRYDAAITLVHVFEPVVYPVPDAGAFSLSFQVADAILLVAYISFLGMGLQPPETDWGAMLTKGITYTYSGAWWLIFPAGLCIVLTVCGFNFIGDGLRNVFDVRGRDL